MDPSYLVWAAMAALAISMVYTACSILHGRKADCFGPLGTDREYHCADAYDPMHDKKYVDVVIPINMPPGKPRPRHEDDMEYNECC